MIAERDHPSPSIPPGRRAPGHGTRGEPRAPVRGDRSAPAECVLLPPELDRAAQHAAQAVYDMRAAGSAAGLQEARERAFVAAGGLVAAAGVVLAA